jgi:transcription elongation factor Elf1
MKQDEDVLKFVVSQPIQDLTEALYSSSTISGRYQIRDIRKVLIKNKDDEYVVIHKCFAEPSTKSDSSSVGWTVNDGVSSCLICSSDFGLLTRRHHCRLCGLLICSSCCSFQEGKSKGKLRVCTNCTSSWRFSVETSL